jgi:hypothetical protein
MTPIENFLTRLDKVKQIGNGEWVACCPAHDDKHPSMSVSEKGDTFVVKCHSQHCGGIAIMESVGLTASDFYEKTDLPIHIRATKRKWTPRQICELIGESSSNVALLCERFMTTGLWDDEMDFFRLELQKLIILSNEVNHA